MFYLKEVIKNTTKNNIFKSLALNIVLLISLITIIIIVTVVYVSSGRFIYVWDYTHYHNLTIYLTLTYKNSWSEGTQLLLSSFNDEYNKLFCLPLIPFILFFGESRLVYILSSALVYLLPFSLIMGVIAAKIITVFPPRLVFWSAVFLSILIPFTWIPILRGFPDLGAATIIGLAILVYLKDINLKSWWQVPLISFLLAFAFIFRRHYAYSLRAFLAALFLQSLLILILEPRPNFKKALRNFLRFNGLICIIPVGILVIMMTVTPQIITRVLTTNYRQLYEGFENSITLNIQWYGETHGWILWSLAIVGYLAGIKTRIFDRFKASFIIIFGSIEVIQWVLTARQLGVHYTTHFTFIIVLGITTLFWTILGVLKNKNRIILIASLIIFLLFNSLISLTPIVTFYNSSRSLFSQSNPPLIRKDFDEIVRLIEYLRKVVSENKGVYPHQAIYVGASTYPLSNSVIGDGEKQLYGRNQRILNTIVTADVDSRDFYPLEKLLEADYIIVGNPVQSGLLYNNIDPQKVIKVVVDIFNNNWQFAQDFKPLPEQFILKDNNVNTDIFVKIFQRIRPTSPETILSTLQIMQNQIIPKPGMQSDWIIFGNPQQNSIQLNPDQTINLKTNDSIDKLSLLYFGSLTDEVKLTGEIELLDSQSNLCSDVSIELAMLDKNEKLINKTEPLKYSTKNSKLNLSLQGKKAVYLRLDLLSHNQDKLVSYCSVNLKNLKILNSKN